MKTGIKRIGTLLLAVVLMVLALPPIAISAAYAFSGGSGTVANPYLVSTPEDVLNIKNAAGSVFRQTCDISMAGKTVAPINQFSGVYDGGGYTLSDVTINHTYYRVGLISTNTGTIQNLHLENAKISGSIANNSLFCGGIVGYNTGTIIGCSVSGSVTGKASTQGYENYVGGLTGLNLGTVEDCRNFASVTADAGNPLDVYAGGIVGNNNKTVKNCLNEGAIRAVNGMNALAAGIAAINFGTITGVKNTAEIYANSNRIRDGYYSDAYAGGAAGYNKGMVSYAENSGSIRAESSADNAEAGGITA